MKAIRIEAFGRPAEVLKVVDVPDVGPPGPDEVVIAVEASPINPYVRSPTAEDDNHSGWWCLSSILPGPSASRLTYPGCGHCHPVMSTSSS
jgi:hypothetical protein